MVITAFLVTGCTELGDVLLAPDEPVVYVEDRPYPGVFDPYYNEPKIYRQPRYYYESTSKKTKGNRVFKTTQVNQTARSFEGLYITDSANKDWDANLLLNGKVLAAGGKIRVRFKRDAKSDTWDFNLVDDEGLSVTFDHVKLAGVDTVTLKNVNGKITAEIE